MDTINKPAHYNQGSIECIDAMKIVLTPEEFRGFLKGNVFKYLWREKGKNGIEDLRKGKDYYDRLIQSFDESEDQPVIKQSSTTEPPDGWRFLEVGEVIRKGDRYFNGDYWKDRNWGVGETYSTTHQKTIRRNRFEVGEKVVHGDLKSTSISTVKSVLSDGWVDLVRDGVSTAYHVKDLAPYIEETKPTVEVAVEVTGEVKNPLGCPDGWRWLEAGEVIRSGDRYFKDHEWIGYDVWVGVKIAPNDRPSIRRNKFEVGEKVVYIGDKNNFVFVVKGARADGHFFVERNWHEYVIAPKFLAPYIEETT